MRVDPAAAMMAEEITPRAEETSEPGADGFAKVFDALVGERPEQEPEAERGDESVPTQHGREAQAVEEEPSMASLLLAGSLLADEAPPTSEASAPLASASPAPSGVAPHPLAPPVAGASAAGAEPAEARGVAPLLDPASANASMGAGELLEQGAGDASPVIDAAPVRSAARPESLPLERGRPVPDALAPGGERAAAPLAAEAASAPASAQPLAVAGALASRGDVSPLPREVSRELAREETRTRAADPRANPRDQRDGRAEAPSELLEQAAEADPEVAAEISRSTAAPASRAAAANAPTLGALGAETSANAPVASFAPGIALESVSTSAPGAMGAPLPPQTVQAVPQQVQLMASQGGGTARIRLSPPELGDLQIQVSLRGTAVDVVIHADERVAQLAVMTQRDQLADALGARELRMEGFDVLDGGRGGPDGDLFGRGSAEQQLFGDETGSGRQPARGPGNGLGAADPQAVGPAPGAPDLRAGGGGVDLRI